MQNYTILSDHTTQYYLIILGPIIWFKWALILLKRRLTHLDHMSHSFGGRGPTTSGSHYIWSPSEDPHGIPHGSHIHIPPHTITAAPCYTERGWETGNGYFSRFAIGTIAQFLIMIMPQHNWVSSQGDPSQSKDAIQLRRAWFNSYEVRLVMSVMSFIPKILGRERRGIPLLSLSCSVHSRVEKGEEDGERVETDWTEL